jgi:endonuclease YncB( thermonuclease family)
MSKTDHPKEEPKDNHNHSATPVPCDKEESANWRQKIGNTINSATEVINENLIVARYTAIASIALLTCYGISKTPLFFRYKSVSEIPSFMFRNRQTLYGRIVHIVEPKTKSSLSNQSTMVRTAEEEPIICLVRQLSPVGRLLNKSTYQSIMERKPSSLSSSELSTKIQKERDLIKVELAGIKAPPFYHAENGGEGTNDWLKRLASDRTPVSCTLISRRILKLVQEDGHWNQIHGNIISQQRHDIKSNSNRDPEQEQVAIAKIMYRPGMSFFRKDLGSSLVSCGRANVASSGMHVEIPSMPTVDGSTKLGDIDSDVKYLEHLSKLEYEAVKARLGMWNVDEIRSGRSDLVDEADFEIHASLWKKLWRKISEREVPWFWRKGNP